MATGSQQCSRGCRAGMKWGTPYTKYYLFSFFEINFTRAHQNAEHAKALKKYLLNKQTCKKSKLEKEAQATWTYSFLNWDFVIVSDWVLPRKVKFTTYSWPSNSGCKLMCSTLSEQQPTVSAVSPSSFSLPALRASCARKGTELFRKRWVKKHRPHIISMTL